MRIWTARVALTALLLSATIWPAIWNGTPFFFPDTSAYFQGAKRVVQILTGKRGPYNVPAARETLLPDQDADSTVPNSGLQSPAHKGAVAPEIAGVNGKSVYYGMLLYLGSLSGRFWPVVLLQALAILVGASLFLSLLNESIWPNIFWIVLLLSVLSDAPFFASFLMPDLFVALAILALAGLMADFGELHRAQAIGAWFLIATGCIFHNSTLPLVLLLACFIPIWNLVHHKSFFNIRQAIVLSALGCALIGQSSYKFAVEHVSHKPMVDTPFLSARLIADGPGMRYLKETCPQSGFILCEYKAVFPLPSNIILYRFWLFSDAGNIVKLTAQQQYDVTTRMSREDKRFAWSVFRFDPGGVLFSTLSNGMKQLADVSLDEFSYNTPASEAAYGVDVRRIFDEGLPPSWLPGIHKSLSYRGKFPVAVFSWFYSFTLLAAFLYSALICFSPSWAAQLDQTIKNAFLWILLGVVVNAIICGGVSGVFPRYGARMTWLVPLIAVTMAFSVRRKGAKECSLPSEVKL